MWRFKKYDCWHRRWSEEQNAKVSARVWAYRADDWSSKVLQKKIFLWYFNKIFSKQKTNFCIAHAQQLFTVHAQLRPICTADMQQFETVLHTCAQGWKDELKNAVCNQLLLLKAQGGGQRWENWFFIFYLMFDKMFQIFLIFKV